MLIYCCSNLNTVNVMKAHVLKDKISISKEAAQEWLENEQFNIAQNGIPSSGKYTVDEIRAIVNTPMKDGTSLLSKLLDWNNVRGVALLVNEYGAVVKSEHFDILKEKMDNPFLETITKEMLRLLNDAESYSRDKQIATSEDAVVLRDDTLMMPFSSASASSSSSSSLMMPFPSSSSSFSSSLMMPFPSSSSSSSSSLMMPFPGASSSSSSSLMMPFSSASASSSSSSSLMMPFPSASSSFSSSLMMPFPSASSSFSSSLMMPFPSSSSSSSSSSSLMTALELNDVPGLTSMLDASLVKIEVKHFKMIREKIKNPDLRDTAEQMLQLLNAAHLRYISKHGLTLSDAIKYHPEVLDQMLQSQSSVVIDTTRVITDLVDAIACGNHHSIKILLKHNVKINWNQQIEGDVCGDTLMIKLAKDRFDFREIEQYITMKYQNGLPIFKVNQENNQGQKLIDIFANRLYTEESGYSMHTINLLRSCGSSEPIDKLLPSTRLKLDTTSPHNRLNEKSVQEIQKELHKSYNPQSLDIDKIFNEIREYITLRRDALKEMLGDDEEGSIIQKGLASLDKIQTSNEVSRQHNNQWLLKLELALVYLTAKKMNILDNFVAVLTEIDGCEWGQVVNLYKMIENYNTDLVEFKPVIDFRPLQEDPAQLANEVYKILCGTMSSKVMKQTVAQFFTDITDYRVMPKDYSTKTELIIGYFFTLFKQMVTDQARSATNIYSEDAIALLNVVQNFAMEYDQSEFPTNILHEIMYKNDYDNYMSTLLPSPTIVQIVDSYLVEEVTILGVD